MKIVYVLTFLLILLTTDRTLYAQDSLREKTNNSYTKTIQVIRSGIDNSNDSVLYWTGKVNNIDTNYPMKVLNKIHALINNIELTDSFVVFTDNRLSSGKHLKT